MNTWGRPTAEEVIVGNKRSTGSSFSYHKALSIKTYYRPNEVKVKRHFYHPNSSCVITNVLKCFLVIGDVTV